MLSFKASPLAFFLVCNLLIITTRCTLAQKNYDDTTTPFPTFDLLTEEALNMKADDSLLPTAADVPTGQLPEDGIGKVRELPPDFTRAVWDESGKICLLATFQASFTIVYSAQGGDQTATVKLPEETKNQGLCGSEHRDPALQILWPALRPSFRFKIFFTTIPTLKKDQPDNWVVTSMELEYNTEATIFVGATNAGLRTARTPENTSLFETAEGKSYFCSAPPPIQMISTKKERAVTVRFQDIQVQPTGIKKAKFSPFNRCSSIRIGGVIPNPYEEGDQTVPITVGSTLAVMAVLVVVGYALYKSIMVRRVDYNTME